MLVVVLTNRKDYEPFLANVVFTGAGLVVVWQVSSFGWAQGLAKDLRLRPTLVGGLRRTGCSRLRILLRSSAAGALSFSAARGLKN